MNIAFFISRPIFAAILSIVMVMAGLLALRQLPVAQFPDISPPQIQVVANYPGASAETVAQTIAAPIEQQVNGSENMLYMNSTSSSNGSLALSVVFDIGTDIDKAQIDVQNRIKMAEGQLPDEVRRNGVSVTKSSSSILLVVAIKSDGRYDPTFVSNYANLHVLDKLKQIPGANQVAPMGSSDYAMRIWLKPDKMAHLSITVADIRDAIEQQNTQFAVGQIGQKPTSQPVVLTLPVAAEGRLTDPREFEDIILRSNKNGETIRLRDVATVELGTQSYDMKTRLNGGDTTLIAVYQQADANALDVATQIRDTMSRLSSTFPAGISYEIPYDTTEFVKISIEEVIHTLFEAIILVIAVVFLFLQNWRSTLIPTLAVPVSMIGTLAGMYFLGFSINTLTLFGMVLAIGLVVDDAIVVIENVERNMRELGLKGREAATHALSEVAGPVIATTLVLIAVFLPVSFLGGMTGQLYKQFAITIAISVTLSAIVALTLSPALAAILINCSEHTENKPRLFQSFDNLLEKFTQYYLAGIRWLLRHAGIGLLLYLGMVAVIVGLFKIIPTSFVPPEDQGTLFTIVKLPDAASLDRTNAVVKQVEDIVKQSPAVRDIASIAGMNMMDGGDASNAGVLFLTLKNWKDRASAELQAENVLNSLRRQLFSIKEAFVMPVNPPSIPGLGMVGGFEFWILNQGEGNTVDLENMTQKVIAKASQRPELQRLSSSINANSQQLGISVNRQKAWDMDVPISDVFDTLQGLFNTTYVNDFNKFGRTYKVLLQAEAQYRSRPEDIEKASVRSRSGAMVPLTSLVSMHYASGPNSISRFNGFSAARINGNAAPGFSSGQAMLAMEQAAQETLPDNMTFAWGGQSFQEKAAGSSSVSAFAYGIVMVFLILAAQYERLILPFAVMLAVPFGLFGAFLLVWIYHMENDVYFQIGLVTLIALSAKNAILIVEFAALKQEQGMSALEAALEACRLRFRPILMTSFSFILGVLPLVLSTGAGANSRHSIGVGIMGGMVSATLLAIFFVPLFFVLLERARANSIVEKEEI
ncbi:efflux RND transporter permease subunit [Candidatus Methylobacter oryzae]|uniref:Efflux pump membrane transporter n=1 Tax=Candidatus Methylobacter oryzae TaxID=2497749 RepID=A0ABY3C673_9GAMM|nr:multidrug efflux RND transporter permease subunit [Candidatus Methylobacter oryzae]TRW90759.1 multidrug efflux RND transporter permease subunit [Candidatus Methylobacter oryzae]